jgi:glycosyltransferase involved in cell wall biosynthesis
VLRVAVDATALLSDLTGVGVFTAGALGALAQRDDLGVVGYAVTWRGQRRLPGLLPAGVRAAHVPMPARPLHELWRRLDAPSIEWFTGPVDIVHGLNYVVPPARRAAEVVTIHDLTYVRFPELCHPATLRYYPALIRRALRRGAMVHAPSRFTAGEIVELLGVADDRVQVVYHGIDALLGGEDHAPAGRPYILAMGTAEPRKDFPRLVEAFDAIAGKHPDLDLVIAGPPGWGENALVGALGRARHGSQIRRLGWVTGQQRSGLLRGATAFAYPTLYEGFGLPPLEAMSAGVPVVTTTAGAVPEIVGDAAWLVPVGDTDALAAALATVVGDVAERTRLIEAGHRRAAMFSWEQCAGGLGRLYADAVTRHRA